MNGAGEVTCRATPFAQLHLAYNRLLVHSGPDGGNLGFCRPVRNLQSSCLRTPYFAFRPSLTYLEHSPRIYNKTDDFKPIVLKLPFQLKRAKV